jgi:penicillin-binding protein 1C
MEGLGLQGMSAKAQRSGLALAIGGVEADARSLATAYGCLALGGRGLHPHLLCQAAGSGPEESLLSASACWAVLHCLSDSERTAAVCPSAVALEPAWKTGTSSGHRDAWCVAVTPRLSVAVWMGTTRGSGSPDLIGAEVAAPLALGLLAALDAGGDSWPSVDMGTPDGTRSAVVPSALVITNPPRGAEILADPDAVHGPCRLSLECRGGGAGQRWWFIDGAPVATVAMGEPAWWTVSAGRHELRVVDADGQAAVVQVAVR